jgi:hypothetical protein
VNPVIIFSAHSAPDVWVYRKILKYLALRYFIAGPNSFIDAKGRLKPVFLSGNDDRN